MIDLKEVGFHPDFTTILFLWIRWNFGVENRLKTIRL